MNNGNFTRAIFASNAKRVLPDKILIMTNVMEKDTMPVINSTAQPSNYSETKIKSKNKPVCKNAVT